jgi:DNA processing protein
MLFVKGRLERESLPLAVVGSRRSSAYGRQALSRILEQALRIYNLNIISGMALGIDSEAHKAALAKGAPTTAVLAGGLNKENIYPAKNASLADEIIKNNGAVISEFPPFTENFKGHFVQRNRIIAGMARGVLVIEAQERSGTLITAGYALEEGREVMAVPGPINTPYSQGTNTLIKKGAHAVTCAEDIGDIFDLTGEVKSAMNNKKEYKDENCQNIITFLKDGPQHINNIAKATGIPPKDLTPRLTSLELEGEIKNLGGMIFGIVK